MPDSFDRNVFLNCPLDKDFLPFLKTLIFTVYRLGFNPRIASERSDSGESRLDKIKELIESSRFSIHDLSRFRSTTHDEFYRLNMPYQVRTWFSELGETELPSASTIWDDYNIFQADLYESKSQRGFNKREIDLLPILEFVKCIECWLRERNLT